jgi:c(7)-type cytochrome triheme protein
MRKLFLALTVILAAGGFVVGQAAAEDFGGGEITYRSTAFSHKEHVGDFGFDCETCHDDLFAMEAGDMIRKPDFSMEAMYQGGFCGACHDGDTAFSADADCTSCHQEGGDIYFDKPVKSVLFSHQTHVHEMGFDCESCHNGTFSMSARTAQKKADFDMNALYDGKYCGACHDGETAFASDTRCASCHAGVKGYERAAGAEAETRTAQVEH